MIYRYPVLLDACAKEMERKGKLCPLLLLTGISGDVMMSKWAEVMTCMRPKSYFLRPDVALPLGFAVLREAINQKFFNPPDLYVFAEEN